MDDEKTPEKEMLEEEPEEVVQRRPIHHAHRKQTEHGTSGDRLHTGMMVIGIIMLLVISFQITAMNNGIATLNSNFASGGGQKAPVANNAPSAPSAPVVDMQALLEDDDFKGDSDAPVTIVEFSDYECPFCARFYSQTLAQIQSEYIDKGLVKFVYRDFPLSLHQNAQKAAEAAECAGEQGKYYDMHNKLFEDGVSGGSATYKQYAKDLGLDTGDFNDCLDSGKMAAEVKKDLDDGVAAGIRGTPGFLINGQLVSGAQPFEAFQQIINAELAK